MRKGTFLVILAITLQFTTRTFSNLEFDQAGTGSVNVFSMNMKYLLLTGGLLFFASVHCFSQNDWALKLDKEGIRVFTKNLENSPFKAVRTVCTIDAPLTRVMAVLLDIPGSVNWLYATKSCSVLKQISPSDIIYYSEIEVPWPVNNRDFVVRIKVSQDERTKAVTILGENKPTFLPENKNVVRIQKSFAKWVIVPLSKNQVKVEYILQVDPGGSVPAWLINMFATKGPYESFKNLREQVKKPAYTYATLPFLKD
jgi:hypothetical protein